MSNKQMRWMIGILLLVCHSAQAARYVPRLMNASERRVSLQVLGFGSAAKILGNPYPLGGFSGVELGITTEYIPTYELASLGDKSTSLSELNYYNFTIGKGLFHNVDTYFHFTPGFQSEDVNAYGAQVRWGFYEFPFMPGGLTLVAHGNATSFAGFVDSRTTGYDLLAAVVIEDVTLYFGLGEARSVGTFYGGNFQGGTTESTTNACVANYCEDAYDDISEGHTIFGINLNYAEYFAAFEINRYYLSTYSAKLGLRF